MISASTLSSKMTIAPNRHKYEERSKKSLDVSII